MSKNNKKNWKSNKKNDRRGNNNKNPHDSKREDPRDRDSRKRNDTDTYGEGDLRVTDNVGSSNDPAWYNKNDTLIKNVATIPMGTQLGSVVEWALEGTPHIDRGGAGFPSTAMSGIIALGSVPVPGKATTASDAVNIAATGVFQYIRKNLSTVASYAPADVMMCILGIDSIYSMYSHIMRAFGIVNLYSSVNYYMPDGLLHSLYGMTDTDINDFKSQLNSYRTRFNNLIVKASTLYLPGDFTIVNRHSWIYSNVFADADSVKSQLYAHYPYYLYVLDETSSSQGTMLKAFEPTTGLSDFGNDTVMNILLNNFDYMIESYRNSDSMNKIQADMRRAFEDRQRWVLDLCPENYMVVPSLSYDVLMQIENTTILSSTGADWTDWDIHQSVNKNIITFDPKCVLDNPAALSESEVNLSMLDYSPILNFHKNDVSQDDILEATRNMLTLTAYQNASGEVSYRLRDFGADIVYVGSIWTRQPGTGGEYGEYVRDSISTMYGQTNTRVVSVWTQFDWAPMLYVHTSGKVYYLLADIENYTNVPSETLARMNKNIIMSMWSIPQLGGIMS